MDTRIADRAEIIDLFARLARVLDERRHEDARTVYTDDVVVDSPSGGELRGIDQIISHLSESTVDDEHTQHLHGDVLVTVHGDQAEAAANQLVYFYREGSPPHRASGLRLSYAAVRTSIGWRFHQARLTVAWTWDAVQP